MANIHNTEAECLPSHKEYVGDDYYFGCGS